MSTEGQLQTRTEIARVRTCLAGSVHFRALQADDLDRLASLSRVYRLRDGQPLYKADGAVDALWIVLSGSLRISSIGDDEEYVYALLGPGSFFGLGFILGGHQGLSVGASAYGATDVAAIDGSRFLQLLDQRPHLWRHFAGVVVRRLSLAMLAMRDISSTSLRERIVRRLLGQAISGGPTLPEAPSSSASRSRTWPPCSARAARR
jgi:CRP-like cAMP-binding protein